MLLCCCALKPRNRDTVNGKLSRKPGGAHQPSHAGAGPGAGAGAATGAETSSNWREAVISTAVSTADSSRRPVVMLAELSSAVVHATAPEFALEAGAELPAKVEKHVAPETVGMAFTEDMGSPPVAAMVVPQGHQSS